MTKAVIYMERPHYATEIHIKNYEILILISTNNQ